MINIRNFFTPAQAVPAAYRRNFLHWYLDIFWFGVLNGSTLIFLSVYVARLGGSVQQIGLLAAAPAVMNLVFTLPMGLWATRLPAWKGTAFGALFTRLFYVLLIPLPFLLDSQAQIWTIIIITLAMNIPGTLLAVVVNAYLAQTVPPQYRGPVMGTRNALMSVAVVLTSWIVGRILTVYSFETGYSIVFAIGFVGAAMSTLHLFLIRPPQLGQELEGEPLPPEIARIEKEARQPRRILRFDILRGSSGMIMLLMFCYQLAVFTVGPIYSVYQVNVLALSDASISLGTVMFWTVHFLVSTQAGRLSRKYSYKRMTWLGVLLIGITVGIFTRAFSLEIYLLHQAVSGLGWGLIGGGLTNYLLELFPANDRQAYLTWYNLVVNAGVLLASFLGPFMAERSSLLTALWIAVAMRILTAYAIRALGSEARAAQGTTQPARSSNSAD